MFEKDIGKNEISKLLDERWKYIKTEIHRLAQYHEKSALIQVLLNIREQHTIAPTLTEITNFIGYDIVIHTLMRWQWKVKESSSNIDVAAETIGKFGAELSVIHAISQSIKNKLLYEDNGILKESSVGAKHFAAVNSFNIDVTGSRIDIARKRFKSSRQNKVQRSMDSVSRLPSVKRLYWENSILMLLRTPLTFYNSLHALSLDDQEKLIEFQHVISQKVEDGKSGVKKVRVAKNSKIDLILSKLTPEFSASKKLPHFVSCSRTPGEFEGKHEYIISLGALTMFSMFLISFNRDQLDQKAERAEKAVKDIIESSGYWEVLETNSEITTEEGETLSEIDIIARSKHPINGAIQTLHCEVKDFSYWKGWIFGQSDANRENYYKIAISKLPIKEEYIKEKFKTDNVISIIVTSVPEMFAEIEGTCLVYVSDLREKLAQLENRPYTPAKKQLGSNFFIRYYRRMREDFLRAKVIQQKMQQYAHKKNVAKEILQKKKEEYQKVQLIHKEQIQNIETLKISIKLRKKRLLQDKGDRHYIILDAINELKKEIRLKTADANRIARNLRVIKEEYEAAKLEYSNLSKLYNREETTYKRILGPRAL